MYTIVGEALRKIGMNVLDGYAWINPPNKALQQTLDPAAPLAVAKGTSASSAAELWR